MDSCAFDKRMCSGLENCWEGGQAVVVRADSAESPGAEMRLYERTDGAWKAVEGPWRVSVGRNGVSKRGEGDGKSPSGAFLLGAAFGQGSGPKGMKYPYRMLDRRDRWVDDAASPFYNRWVRGPREACGRGEDLSETPQYKLAVAVRYNDEAEKGAGSAIFLHIRLPGDQGTQGCTSISGEDMDSLLRWLEYDKRPVLVQGTDGDIARLMEGEWGLACLPPGWGFADDFVPDTQLEIRYNTPNNFTGRKIPGYRASLAPMRLEALAALSHAAEELRQAGIGIRIYDAYRPQRASDAMIAWAEDTADTRTKEEYYPGIEKKDIPGKFVARRSAHRLGGTVDLTLLQWETGENLDMGGPFDFFGELSAYGCDGIAGLQAQNRTLLRNVMLKYGFTPYEREWWHFAFPVDGEGGDFPILPRECKL